MTCNEPFMHHDRMKNRERDGEIHFTVLHFYSQTGFISVFGKCSGKNKDVPTIAILLSHPRNLQMSINA